MLYFHKSNYTQKISHLGNKKLSASADPLTRGSAPEPRWGHSPQIPNIPPLSAIPSKPRRTGKKPDIKQFYYHKNYSVVIVHVLANSLCFLLQEGSALKRAGCWVQTKLDECSKPVYCPSGDGKRSRMQLTTHAGMTTRTPLPRRLPCIIQLTNAR